MKKLFLLFDREFMVYIVKTSNFTLNIGATSLQETQHSVLQHYRCNIANHYLRQINAQNPYEDRTNLNGGLVELNEVMVLSP